MATPPTPEKEALHLLLIRVVVYTGAVLLFVAPLAQTAGIIAAVLAVPLGIFLGHRLGGSRLRLPVLGLGVAVVLVVGGFMAGLLENTVWMVELLGLGGSMTLIQVMNWGLGIFATVFALRVLATRFPPLAVLEIAVVTAVVAYLFAGHRDYHVDQPRTLSDWAYSRGHDPKIIFLILGVMTLGALALLLLDKQKLTKTLMTMVTLFFLCLIGYWLVLAGDERRDTNYRPNKNRRKRKPSKNQGGQGKQGGQGGGQGNQGGQGGGQSGQGGGGQHEGPGGQPKPEDPFDPPPRDKKPGPNRVVAVVTFHEGFQPVEHGYYFRSQTYSRFLKNKMVPAELPGVDADTQKGYPEKPVHVQTCVLTLVSPEFGKVELFQVVPTSVALVMKEKGAFALIRPMTLEPEKNPDPKQFLLAYRATSAVMLRAKVNVYLPTKLLPETLRAAGVPDATAAKLKRLGEIDGYFREPVFRDALRRLLTPEEFTRYHAKLMDLARMAHEVHPFELLKNYPAGDPAWPENVRKMYLEYPNDPRYKQLADEIIAKEIRPDQRHSALLRALAFKKWIYENTIYTKFMDHSKAADPIASYLFGNRHGKCTHIAHAMTYLLRSQGIPARVAGGYMVEPDRRKQGKGFLILQSDAHAWCEIYLHGIGWINMDAFSKRSIDPKIPGPPPVLQKQLLKKANPDKLPEEEALDQGWNWAVLLWVLLIVPGGLSGLYAVKLWRRLAPRFAGEGSLYRLCYRAILDRLAEVGLYRQFGETREEFAQRMAKLSPEFATLSLGHMREAVGGLPTFNHATWMDLKGRIDATIIQAFSRWRRAWGVINPVNWLWVR